MKANPNSIHAKLYRFTYSGRLPKNLCPYFWKLVIATILLPLNFLLQAPSRTWGYLTKDELDNAHEYQGYGIMVWAALILVSLILWCFYHLVLGIFGFEFNLDAAVFGAVVFLVIGFFVARHYYIEWERKENAKKRSQGKRVQKEDRPNIIVEFAKAKYNNYCPKIDWEET